MDINLILSLIFNFIMGSTWIFTYRAFKRKANADADITYTDARLKELSYTKELIDIYNGLSADQREMFNEKIKSMEDKIEIQNKKITDLESKRCLNIECTNRVQ